MILLLSGRPARTSDPAVVSDSGAESCTEDKLRTAQVFMTGIQSAILSSTIPDTGVPADTGEDIVSEVSQRAGRAPRVIIVCVSLQVENVLSKLMASLQRGLLALTAQQR